MFRLTTLKLSLLSAFATLFLLVAMLASTGTASTHTSSQATASYHAHIFAMNTVPLGGDCEETQVFGYGFAPGFIRLVAIQDGQILPLAPHKFFSFGSFSRNVIVCGLFDWGYGYGWNHDPVVLVAMGPHGVHSNPVFLFYQVSQFTVTNINAWVSPTTYPCGQSGVTFNFSATITLSPNSTGGNITYSWVRSDGATMAPITISVPAGQTHVTVFNTWTLGQGAPAGSYWEQVVVTGPNSITSNKATFTKPC